jgi:alpha-L-fucosidase
LDDGSTDVVAYSRPTPQQLNTQNRQLGVFCHFGLPTWAKTREEYMSVFCTNPDMPDSSRFDPKKFDAEQWVLTAKAFGAKWFVFTTKHHDGFCLWPSGTTDYSMKNVPWKNGKGDVVAEVAAACRKHNMPLGLYCSPADKNFQCYSTFHSTDANGKRSRTLVGDPDAYINIYKEQLREVLTNYGPLCEVWLDGCLDPFGTDVTDPKTGKLLGRKYADEVVDLIKSLQPDALIYQGLVGPATKRAGRPIRFGTSSIRGRGPTARTRWRPPIDFWKPTTNLSATVPIC